VNCRLLPVRVGAGWRHTTPFCSDTTARVVCHTLPCNTRLYTRLRWLASDFTVRGSLMVYAYVPCCCRAGSLFPRPARLNGDLRCRSMYRLICSLRARRTICLCILLVYLHCARTVIMYMQLRSRLLRTFSATRRMQSLVQMPSLFAPFYGR